MASNPQSQSPVLLQDNVSENSLIKDAKESDEVTEEDTSKDTTSDFTQIDQENREKSTPKEKQPTDGSNDETDKRGDNPASNSLSPVTLHDNVSENLSMLEHAQIPTQQQIVKNETTGKDERTTPSENTQKKEKEENIEKVETEKHDENSNDFENGTKTHIGVLIASIDNSDYTEPTSTTIENQESSTITLVKEQLTENEIVGEVADCNNIHLKSAGTTLHENDQVTKETPEHGNLAKYEIVDDIANLESSQESIALGTIDNDIVPADSENMVILQEVDKESNSHNDTNLVKIASEEAFMLINDLSENKKICISEKNEDLNKNEITDHDKNDGALIENKSDEINTPEEKYQDIDSSDFKDDKSDTHKLNNMQPESCQLQNEVNMDLDSDDSRCIITQKNTPNKSDQNNAKNIFSNYTYNPNNVYKYNKFKFIKNKNFEGIHQASSEIVNEATSQTKATQHRKHNNSEESKPIQSDCEVLANVQAKTDLEQSNQVLKQKSTIWNACSDFTKQMIKNSTDILKVQANTKTPLKIQTIEKNKEKVFPPKKFYTKKGNSDAVTNPWEVAKNTQQLQGEPKKVFINPDVFHLPGQTTSQEKSAEDITKQILDNPFPSVNVNSSGVNKGIVDIFHIHRFNLSLALVKSILKEVTGDLAFQKKTFGIHLYPNLNNPLHALIKLKSLEIAEELMHCFENYKPVEGQYFDDIVKDIRVRYHEGVLFWNKKAPPVFVTPFIPALTIVTGEELGPKIPIDKNAIPPLNNGLNPFDTNTYGLSMKFLERYKITLPLGVDIAVENLFPKMTEGQMRNVFGLAGIIQDLTLYSTPPNILTLRIRYDHPLEAVQAMSMFNHQKVYGRLLKVKMLDQSQCKPRKITLPQGLDTIGPGLGPNGSIIDGVRLIMEIEKLKMKCGKQINGLKTTVNRLKEEIKNMSLPAEKVPSNDNDNFAQMLTGSFQNPLATLGLVGLQQGLQQIMSLNAGAMNNMADYSMSHNNMPQSNMIHNNMALSNMIQNNMVENTMSQNNMSQSNMIQNNMALSNMIQNNMVENSMSQNNMSQSNMIQNNMALSNMSQNNMVENSMSQNNMSQSNMIQNNMALSNMIQSYMGQNNMAQSNIAQSNAVPGKPVPNWSTAKIDAPSWSQHPPNVNPNVRPQISIHPNLPSDPALVPASNPLPSQAFFQPPYQMGYQVTPDATPPNTSMAAYHQGLAYPNIANQCYIPSSGFPSQSEILSESGESRFTDVKVPMPQPVLAHPIQSKIFDKSTKPYNPPIESPITKTQIKIGLIQGKNIRKETGTVNKADVMLEDIRGRMKTKLAGLRPPSKREVVPFTEVVIRPLPGQGPPDDPLPATKPVPKPVKYVPPYEEPKREKRKRSRSSSSARPDNRSPETSRKRTREHKDYSRNDEPDLRHEISRQKEIEKGKQDKTIVCFKYLPPSVTLEDLREKMSEIGTVVDVRLHGEGRATVAYKHARDAYTCIVMYDQSKVDGQLISVKRS